MSEIEITIRPYEDQDFQAISDLIVNNHKTTTDIPTNHDIQLNSLDITDDYSKGSSGFWVAVADEKVVGSIALLDITNNAAAMQKLVFTEHHWDTETGVASKLFSHLFYEAQMCGIRDIFLGTRADLTDAHRLYEKHGFIRDSTTDLPSRFPIVSIDSHFYHKSI